MLKSFLGAVKASLRHAETGIEQPAVSVRMSETIVNGDQMPEEIDFSSGVRGLHHIPPGAKVFLPASIEQSVWQYFSAKAQQKGVDLSELLTDVLKRDIEINEALK